MDPLLTQALQLHRAGRLPEAEALYRQALARQPNSPELLGNLGNVLAAQGQFAAAIASYRAALELKPDHSRLLLNLGSALTNAGQFDEAMATFQRALALNPKDAHAIFNNLGLAARRQGQLAEAIAAFRRAIELQPNSPEPHKNLGDALLAQGRHETAIAAFQSALRLRPNYTHAHYNLGNAQLAQGRLGEAIASYRAAIQYQPNFAEAHYNLANALQTKGDLDAAIAAYRITLKRNPNFADAHNNLGNALKDQALLDEAIACFRQALALDPHHAVAHSNLIYTLFYHPDSTPQTLRAEHDHWENQHAAPLSVLSPQSSVLITPSPRRLRIGYVSPDFRNHPVGRFLLPLLAAHDHKDFEIVCYSSVHKPDELTAELRTHADLWREAASLSDAQLADLIRADQIDILVDLTMHMAFNRLLVFARKPAPVQVTYLAYAGTTGLKTVDCRLTDPHLDPPGAADDSIYSEQSVRLPETWWCYTPPPQAQSLPPSPLPAATAGHITFGCLNNFCKNSDPALRTWRTILSVIPNSRLLLHARPGSHRDRITRLMAEAAIAPDRLEFVDLLPAAAYFALYHRIDIVLDPFPYAGGTTSCDALWMGVPLITLAGRTAVGRAGVSILSNLNLPELIARTTDEYIQIATALAADLPHLTQLRATLRQRLQSSPLTDAPRFARHVESAYRTMWRQACHSRPIR